MITGTTPVLAARIPGTMKSAPLDYLTLGKTRIAATGVAAVFGATGTGKTSRAVFPVLKQFDEKLACAVPALYLSSKPTDVDFDRGKVVVQFPRPEHGGAPEDTEWQEFVIDAVSQFAQSTEVYRALAIDADVLGFVGSDGVSALVNAIRSTAASVSKFLLIAAPSIKQLPSTVREELGKAATTRIFFTLVDTDTMDLVRTTVFPRPFWLPRRIHPRDLRANGRFADAIVEIEIGKDKESHFLRLPAVKKITASPAAAHMERFSK